MQLNDVINGAYATGAAAGAALTGALVALKWWYHVRKLARADRQDGSISRSLEFVLDQLHREIASLKTEVALLKLENADLRGRQCTARDLLHAHTASEEQMHRDIVNQLEDPKR